MPRFGLWYDFRNPAQWRRPLTDVYAETFEQIAWAETLGYADAWTTEHHFVPDDYSPSVLAICAAIAARTRTMRVGTSVLLLPMHDPVRVAEDAATVDVISGGRLDLGVALGYRLAEFAALGIPTNGRGRRMDEASEVLLRAWAPGPFTFEGAFYRYASLDVTPKPVQSPMPLWFGGLSPAAVKRAARFGTGFMAGAGPDLIPLFREERARLGRPPGEVSKALGFHAVARDPEAAWARVAPHVHYQRKLYAAWLNEAGTNIWPEPASPDEIRAAEPDLVVTPGRAKEIIAAALAANPGITHFHWAPVPPGLRPRDAAEGIALFAKEVMPAFVP